MLHSMSEEVWNQIQLSAATDVTQQQLKARTFTARIARLLSSFSSKAFFTLDERLPALIKLGSIIHLNFLHSCDDYHRECIAILPL